MRARHWRSLTAETAPHSSYTNVPARFIPSQLRPSKYHTLTGLSRFFRPWLRELHQSVAKRASVIALIISVCKTTHAWTPYFYNGAPRYFVTFTVNLVSSAAAEVVATVTRLYLGRQYQKLERGEPTNKSGPTTVQTASKFSTSVVSNLFKWTEEALYEFQTARPAVDVVTVGLLTFWSVHPRGFPLEDGYAPQSQIC